MDWIQLKSSPVQSNCKGSFGPLLGCTPGGSQELPRLAFGQPLAPPYKLLGLTALSLLIGSSPYEVLPYLLFTISSSSIDSPCDSCSACLLPTVHLGNSLTPIQLLALSTNLLHYGFPPLIAQLASLIATPLN